MTILDWLIKSMRELKEAGVDSPRRDSLVLIEDLLKKDRSWVNAHADFELSAERVKKLDRQINRRTKREPLAYIRGKAWFYGRFFKVNAKVLVPRPETESFIELIKEFKPETIIDVGTGSGCLAITAQLELPESRVTAVDVDDNALGIARENARGHKVNIKFSKGDLLEPVKDLRYDGKAAILANLPYVKKGLSTSEELKYEPRNAWFSGDDGLDHYRRFWSQVQTLFQKPDYILVESLEDQHEAIAKLAEEAGYNLFKTDILVQVFKPA